MMFGFVLESVSGGEWILLLAVILIVVGPKNLPATARKIGNVMSTLRRAADEFKRQLMTMDDEMRKAADNIKNEYIDVKDEVNEAVNEQSTPSNKMSDMGADVAGDSSESSSDGMTDDDYRDLYGENFDNPYPGNYYDETQYDDAGPEMGDGSSGAIADASGAVEQENKVRLEEKYAPKITVSKAPATAGDKA